MENAIVHCLCGADFCPQCCDEVMAGREGPLQCPACKQTTTRIQRVLSDEVINKLNTTREVLDRAMAGKSAAVNAYDCNCRLWRLPTAADMVAKKGDGASESKQQKQNCGVPSVLMPQPLSAAAATTAAFNGRVVGRQPNLPAGAPVLQSTLATTTSTAATTVPRVQVAASDVSAIQAARYQGMNALSMQLLGQPLDSIPPDQFLAFKSVETVFDHFLQGGYQFAPQSNTTPLAGTVMQQVDAVRRLLTSSAGANGRSQMLPPGG
jgi:hypothetical protein